MSKRKSKIAISSFTDLSLAGAAVLIQVTVYKGFTLTARIDRETREIVVTRQVNGRGNRAYELARCATEEKAAQVMADELGLDVAKDFGLRL